MATEIADIDDLVEGIPPGAWVAISEKLHKVLAYGIDLRAVLDEAHQMGEELPLIVRLPEQSLSWFLAVA